MNVLGIETSCDETAVAVVTDQKEILYQAIQSQIAEHQPFGGVVPEISARSHLTHLPHLLADLKSQHPTLFQQLDGVAVTAGPGLIGGVMVGVMVAKAIASVHRLPFLAVNHLIGHALSPRLAHDLAFPYLMLLASGGHCQLGIVHSHDHFEILGTTLDDAIGECFDKSAKMLGLPYPGGPHIEKLARLGAPHYQLPIPLKHDPDRPFSFSFSGIKSAVRRLVETAGPLTEQSKADIAASLQKTLAIILQDRVRNALRHCQQRGLKLHAFSLVGGVASNQYLRDNLSQLTNEYELPFMSPPASLCTDNAAMIAWAGLEKLKAGMMDSLNFKPRPRWPLTERA